MNDGMTMVRIGIDRATSKAYMKYYGPVGYENPVLWDMVSPPKEEYPYILQYVISIASIECGMPLKGKIQFINRHKILATNCRRLAIDINIPDDRTIELSWPESVVKRHDFGSCEATRSGPGG